MVFDWTVIGGGPAGIAAVGKLLDEQVPTQKILWIDPHFEVGDFGRFWRYIPSNTKVKSFLSFLTAIQAFNFAACTAAERLKQIHPEDTCELDLMAEPLQWITNQFRQQVTTATAFAKQIYAKERLWQIQTKDHAFQSKKVILAIGAEPKHLTYPQLVTIPLTHALNPKIIHEHLSADDCVAVFGSSHSAVLALRNLIEHNVKRVINFYRSPLRYAVYMNDWILFDDSGLKGNTAEWARTFLNGNLPFHLKRFYANEDHLRNYLPHCNKAIYAIGFERRAAPNITEHPEHNYIKECGIIAPGLFGFGIAYPEAKHNKLGILEHRVGLAKFMDYLQRIMPIWMQYGL